MEGYVVRFFALPAGQALTPDPSALRMSAGMRLVLALVALAITYIDPTEPSRFAEATYAVLAGYVLFSTVLLVDLMRWRTISPLAGRYPDWMDVAFYIALIGLSGGTNSVYFVLFFFAILVTSFRLGFGSGLAVTSVSVILFVIVGYAMRPSEAEFDLNQYLLRSCSLLLLGYMISYWGGYELRLKRRLTLLKEISTFSNPRFGVDRTLAVNMERLRSFFDATACVVAMHDTEGLHYELRRAVRGDPESALRAEKIPRELASALLRFPKVESVFFSGQPNRWWSTGRVAIAMSRSGKDRHPADPEMCRSVAEILDAGAFLSVPLHGRSRFKGRLFLVADSDVFHMDDMEFLLQAVEQILPIMDHIVLVDRLATRASEDERRRIALDIHDRFIQPYVGIQLGISSLQDVLVSCSDQPAVAALRVRMAQLEEMTKAGIGDLRLYVDRLRLGLEGSDGLAHSLHRFVERFSELTGIAISLKVAAGLQLSDRLGAEVFSIVSEGLSNIRRHTEALCGCVHVKKVRDRLVVMIENKNIGRTTARSFLPRSIAARVDALQGSLTVKTDWIGCTCVIVEIPL